jgi:hypothetical protein
MWIICDFSAVYLCRVSGQFILNAPDLIRGHRLIADFIRFPSSVPFWLELGLAITFSVMWRVCANLAAELGDANSVLAFIVMGLGLCCFIVPVMRLTDKHFSGGIYMCISNQDCFAPWAGGGCMDSLCAALEWQRHQTGQ